MSKINQNQIISLTIILIAFVLSKNLVQLLFSNLDNVQFLSKAIYGNFDVTHRNSLYFQGFAAFKQQNYEQSIVVLQRLDSNTLARWYLAQAYDKVDKWYKALEYLDLNVAMERQLYGDILLARLPNASDQEQYEWIERVRKEYPDNIILYAQHLLRSQRFEQARIWAKSAPDYEQSVEALILVGRSYFYTNQMVEAINVFRLAYTRFPGDLTAYWYGRTFLVIGKLDMAILLLEEAIQTDDAYLKAFYMIDLSNAYVQIGQCTEANFILNQALQQNIRDLPTDRVESIHKRIDLCNSLR